VGAQQDCELYETCAFDLPLNWIFKLQVCGDIHDLHNKETVLIRAKCVHCTVLYSEVLSTESFAVKHIADESKVLFLLMLYL